MLLVDVADQTVVHGVPHQLLQPAGEGLDECWGHAELLVLLLPDVAGAVVHGDADPTSIGLVGTAAMPETPHPDQHASLGISAAMVS